MFHWPCGIESLKNFNRLVIDAAVHAGDGEVIIQFAHCFFQRLRFVGVWFCDITECDKLLKSSLGRCRRDLLIGWVHPVIAFHFVPARNALDPLGYVLVNIEEHFAIHVLTHRQTEEMQKRRANIEKVSSVDALVLLNPRPFGDEDAELAMLHRRAGRLARDASGTQVIGMETVVGHQDDSAVLARELQQRPEHHVVVAIPTFQAVVENAEVPFFDVVLLRRMIPHERDRSGRSHRSKQR